MKIWWVYRPSSLRNHDHTSYHLSKMFSLQFQSANYNSPTKKNYNKPLLTTFKTMVPGTFDLLWKKLWFYTKNYGTLIYNGEIMVLYRKLWNFDWRRKNPWHFTKNNETLTYYGTIVKQWKFLKNFDLLREKTMVAYRKLYGNGTLIYYG